MPVWEPPRMPLAGRDAKHSKAENRAGLKGQRSRPALSLSLNGGRQRSLSQRTTLEERPCCSWQTSPPPPPGFSWELPACRPQPGRSTWQKAVPATLACPRFLLRLQASPYFALFNPHCGNLLYLLHFLQRLWKLSGLPSSEKQQVTFVISSGSSNKKKPLSCLRKRYKTSKQNDRCWPLRKIDKIWGSLQNNERKVERKLSGGGEGSPFLPWWQ